MTTKNKPARHEAATPSASDYAAMTLAQLARVIVADWRAVYFGAVPYLDAMLTLESIDDPYFAEDGRTVVIYFLSNAQTWRGETAGKVRAELQKRIRGNGACR